MPKPEKKSILAISLLLAAVLLTYSNHFHNAFHFDDSHTVLDNPYIRSLSNLGIIFSDARAFSTLPAHYGYRPLVTASLAVDYKLGNGLNPLYFHVSTFFWFLVQLVLMYLLFRRICDSVRPEPANRWIALFAVALYGLHPAMAETVNYVIQRGDIYSTLGVIAGLLWYAAAPGLRRSGLYLIPVVLALLSKPPALIFPAILLTYLWLIENERFSRAAARCLPAIVVTCSMGLLTSALTPPTFVGGARSASAYYLTQPLVAFRYFRTFFFPDHLNADTDLAPLTSILDAQVWLGFAFIGGIVIAALWCSRKPGWQPTAFGLWWFCLALIPTAVVPLAEVENDHRMYFPFAGLALAVCWSVSIWFQRRPLMQRRFKFAAAGLFVAVLGALASGAHERNEVWRTEESLWRDVTIKSPNNGRGLMNYGLTLMSKGDYPGALDYFERAAVFNPTYDSLEINRGIANGALNRDSAAEQHFIRAIALSPLSAEGHYFYGRWLGQKGRWPEAVAQGQQAGALNPDYLPPRYWLLEAYAQRGDWESVRNASDSILQRFPSDATAADYRAKAAAPLPQPPAAVPSTPEDYLNLSLSFHRAGNFQQALQAAEQALKLRPDYAEAYNNIAAAYEGLQMWDPAITAAQQAVKIRPNFELARNNLRYSQEQKSKTSEKR